MKHLIVILLSLILLSCHGVNKPKKPENLLSKSKMIDIIVDIALFTSAKGINKYEIQEQGILPEAYIYNKHNVDSLQFAMSNEYYSYDIEVYEFIYQGVHDSLQTLKTEYKRLHDEERQTKKENDSIRKATLLDSVRLSNGMIKKRTMKPVSEMPDSLR